MKKKLLNTLLLIIVLLVISIFIIPRENFTVTSPGALNTRYENLNDYNPSNNAKLIMNGLESGFFFNFNRLIHYLVKYPNITEIDFKVYAKINNSLPFIGDGEEIFSKLFEPYKEKNTIINEVLDIDKNDWRGLPFAGGDASPFYNNNRYKFKPYYNAFKKYITLKPALQKKLDKYIIDMKKDCHQVIGIFVRSNALANEQPKHKMPRRKDYIDAIKNIDTKSINTKYFLRIDNNEDLNFYKNTFTKHFYLDMKRADTNKFDAPHNTKKFLPLEELEKIYIEIALLSNCEYIVHCSSNMVSSALFMNMDSISIFVENNE